MHLVTTSEQPSNYISSCTPSPFLSFSHQSYTPYWKYIYTGSGRRRKVGILVRYSNEKDFKNSIKIRAKPSSKNRHKGLEAFRPENFSTCLKSDVLFEALLKKQPSRKSVVLLAVIINFHQERSLCEGIRLYHNNRPSHKEICIL